MGLVILIACQVQRTTLHLSVFTISNSSLDNVDDRSSNTVVGNASYNKVERLMAVLNVFINFVQTFLETRLQALSQRPGNITHYIFTDSDIAVVDDLGQVFHDHPKFHLALTFRNNNAQPLNSGFIAVRGAPEAI